MSSCQCQGIEKLFNDKTARRDLKHYRRSGPHGLTTDLIAFLKEHGITGNSLLDIGGGIGAIQHELVAAGATRVTSVDASSGYLAISQKEAESLGYADRASYYHGDFVELADSVDDADIVTLDKVLCCYDKVDDLVKKSVAKTKRYYAIIYPRTNILAQLFIYIANIFMWVTRSGVRFFLHPSEHVEAMVEDAGLKPVHRLNRSVWQLVVYSR